MTHYMPKEYLVVNANSMNDPSELVPIEDALIKQRTSERKSIY